MIYKDSSLHFNQPHPGNRVKTWISCLRSQTHTHIYTLKISSPGLEMPFNHNELVPPLFQWPIEIPEWVRLILAQTRTAGLMLTPPAGSDRSLVGPCSDTRYPQARMPLALSKELKECASWDRWLSLAANDRINHVEAAHPSGEQCKDFC